MHYFIYLLGLLFFMACSSNIPKVSSVNQSVNQELTVAKEKKSYDLSRMYDGHTFNVYVNGQKVRFNDSFAELRIPENYLGSSKSIQWHLLNSTMRNIRIRIEAIDNLNSYIGYLKPDAFEASVFPLQKIHLNSQTIQDVRDNVLVNGFPMLTQINLLENQQLPAGEYILKVTVKGRESWDSKKIYFKVEEARKKVETRGAFAPFSWYVLPIGKHQHKLAKPLKTQKNLSIQDENKVKKLTEFIYYHKQKRDFSKALMYQNKLTSYYEEFEGKESLLMADMYNNKALLHQDLGEHEEALNYNQKSLEIKLKYYPKQHDAISTNYDNMGVVYYSLGQYAEAIKFLKKSLAIREEYFPKKDASLADSHNNLAIVFADIGNHKEALRALKKALSIRKETVGEQHATTASVYSAMGGVYEILGQYKKAIKSHKRSIEIHEQVLNHQPKNEALASAYGGMGTFYHRQENYKEAIVYYMKMLAIRKSVVKTKSLSLSEVYNNIGVSYMKLNAFEKAKVYLEKSIALKERILGANSNTLQEEYKNLGWLYFRKGEYKQAYVYATKSAEILLTKRDGFFTVLDALEYEHFIKNNQKQMDLLFQCTYYLGDRKSYETSFSYWLRYKGAMLDNQNRMTALYAQKHDVKIKEKVDKLLQHQRSLSKLYQRKVEKHNIENLALALKEHEEETQRLKTVLFGELKPFNMNLKSLLTHLSSEQLYVDFARIGQHYFGFAIDAQGEIYFRRISIKNTKKIDQYVLSFRKKMKEALHKRKEDNKQELTALYNMLLKTLLEKFVTDKKELVISADGLLRLLPFEALFSTKEQQYLVEYKQVQYIPSGREFVRLQKTKKSVNNNTKVVVFADPDFDEFLVVNNKDRETRSSNNRMFQMHFSNLKGTKEEAKSIKHIMQKQNVLSYEGIEANEENLLKIKQPKILHIATHGFFIKSELSNPMLNAGIALTGANTALKQGRGEGVVTALKLSGMDLKGTELVVLSACETGLTAVNAPDSVSVLSKAFMQAGAKSVIASLWSVSDEGTKNLMELFYKEIKQGLPYAQALKKAKMKMIKQGVSPAIWSAFVLNGDE